jgi:hypothetical protein
MTPGCSRKDQLPDRGEDREDFLLADLLAPAVVDEDASHQHVSFSYVV